MITHNPEAAQLIIDIAARLRSHYMRQMVVNGWSERSDVVAADEFDHLQVIKVFGIVNSSTDFKHQHLVMDGCSDVIMEVFDKPVGYHARSAIGTNTLPLDASVEVEAIVKIKS